MGSFSLSGGVEVFGFISPSNTSDQYPVIDPLYGIDGLRNVNSLTELNSIPNLRRRAGMIVGVSGGTIFYKLNVGPWNGTITDWSLFSLGSDFTGGTVTGSTIFTNGLSANTISATTYFNLPTDVFVTGGTFNNGVITLTNNTGGTFNISGISSFDTFVTGFSYTDNTFIISQNSGNSFSVTIDTVTGLTINGDLTVTGSSYTDVISATTYLNLPSDIYVTGYTYNDNTFTIERSSGQPTLFTTINNVTGLTINGDLNVTGITYTDVISATTYQNLPIDVFVTGGTFSGGVITLINNTGGTFTISGISSFDTFVTGGTLNKSTDTITFTNNSGNTFNVTGITDTFVTGATFSGTTLIINQNENQPNVTANLSTVSLSGALSSVTFNFVTTGGITASTVSATTYLNLPTDVRVTGGTYNSTSGVATFTNNTGGTFNVSGFFTGSTDIRVTGATYSNNTFTYTNNTGGTFNVLFNTVTGLTVNGNLSVTGNTNVRGITGTTGLFSGSGQSILTIIGSGSTLPLFTVQGSSGELFSVTDSLTGSLFSVNDISGLPIFEVFSDNTVLMGSYLAPSLNTSVRMSASTGTTNIYSIPTSAYTGAFFDYTVSDGTNLRAGNIMSIWSGTSVNLTEVQTTDFGNTSGITFNMVVSSGNAILRTSGTTTGWTVKTIVRSI